MALEDIDLVERDTRKQAEKHRRACAKKHTSWALSILGIATLTALVTYLVCMPPAAHPQASQALTHARGVDELTKAGITRIDRKNIGVFDQFAQLHATLASNETFSIDVTSNAPFLQPPGFYPGPSTYSLRIQGGKLSFSGDAPDPYKIQAHKFVGAIEDDIRLILAAHQERAKALASWSH